MAAIRKRTWSTKQGTHIAWTVDFIDHTGTRRRRLFESRGKADEFRMETENQIRTGCFRPEAAKATVQDAAELFIRHCERRLERKEGMSRGVYVWYAGQIRNYICPSQKHYDATVKYRKRVQFEHGLGHLKLSQLTARTVSEFRDHLRDTGLSANSTRKILGLLKMILDYAINQDLLGVNVAQRVRVIARRDEAKKKIVPPTKEALKQLLAVAPRDFRVKLLFAAMTGLRAGEFHALRWRAIDLVRGEVIVTTRVDRFRQEDVTKTDAGMRTVPMGIELVAELKAWKLRAKRNGPDDIVFPNKRGWYEDHPNMVKRDFDPLFLRQGQLHEQNPAAHTIPPVRFNWHALRHFAVSCWIDLGLAPKTIQTFAGHATLAITMDRYGHLFKSEEHKAAMDEFSREFAAPSIMPMTEARAVSS
jgi:integrase